jgi:replicative DNA helicase
MDFKEQTLLRQMLSSNTIAERVLPYMKTEYFASQECATIYIVFQEFYEKYHTLPSFAALRMSIEELPNLSERESKSTLDAVVTLEQTPVLDATQDDFLIAEAEKYCQDRAIYVALRKSVAMLDDEKSTPHAIPDILRDALAVSFDTHVGHDFLVDAEARYDFYHRAESRIPFDIDVFNTITKGGIPKKTLNVVLAGTNVGKSLFLVHMAAACLRMSKNVLYITLEMAEERIAERIDANTMNLPMDDVVALPRAQYMRKIESLRLSSTGRVIIKEYPTAAAHVGHFRALFQELRAKQNFVPDIVYVDYLSICASARVKMGASINSYTYNKSIAEELRGLAVEFDIPIFTAAQFNRDGAASSDPGLDKISESFAIAQTADFIVAMTTSEELEKNNQIQIYTLKNRYGKRQSYQKFLLGVDTSRMKLYETGNTSSNEVDFTDAAAPPSDTFQSSQKSGFGFSNRARRPLGFLKTDTHVE